MTRAEVKPVPSSLVITYGLVTCLLLYQAFTGYQLLEMPDARPAVNLRHQPSTDLYTPMSGEDYFQLCYTMGRWAVSTLPISAVSHVTSSQQQAPTEVFQLICCSAWSLRCIDASYCVLPCSASRATWVPSGRALCHHRRWLHTKTFQNTMWAQRSCLIISKQPFGLQHAVLSKPQPYPHNTRAPMYTVSALWQEQQACHTLTACSNGL